MQRWLLLILMASAGLASLPVLAAAPENDQETAESAPHGALSTGGSYYVTFTTEPDPVPLNELFEVHIQVARADDHQALVAGAKVSAGAFMPLHNHGTTLQPQVESHGDGKATAKGFLLHMEGQWELRIGVAVGGQMERVTFEIQLEP